MPTPILSAPVSAAAAFSAELRKARTFPTLPRTLLLGMLLMLAAGVFGIVQMAQFTAAGRDEELAGLTQADWPLILLHFAQVVPILLGGWVVGQDLPTGPRRTASLAVADRGTLITVKYLTAAVIGLLAGVLCSIAALLPLLFSGGDGGQTVSLASYAWLVGYWAAISTLTAALVMVTRSLLFGVVPVLIWTIGISDLLAAQFPALQGALDQVAKTAYLQGGVAPSLAGLISGAIQLVILLAVGAICVRRRDAQ